MAIKTNEVLILATTWMNLEDKLSVQASYKRVHAVLLIYDSIYMKCEEQANPQKQKVNWWLPRTVGG